MFPTKYRGSTPREALKNYVLHPKPPLDDSAARFDYPVASSVEPVTDSESSSVDPTLTKAEADLFVHTPSLLDNLSKSLDDLLIPETTQPPEQQTDAVKQAISTWNLIAKLHDSGQFLPVTRERGASGAGLVGSFETYKDREAANVVYPVPEFGSEYGLTVLFQQSVCSLANHFVRQECLFRSSSQYYARHIVSAPLIGSGTTDLLGVQASPYVPPDGSLDIRSFIFLHRPYMSLQDLMRLLIELESETLQVTFADRKAEWPKLPEDSIDAITRYLLLLIVEQMHANQARYCVLGTWDYYLVFYLNDGRVVECSDIISRDPADNDEIFKAANILKEANLQERKVPNHIADEIRPSPYSLLQVLVSLMVQESKDEPMPILWKDTDRAASELFKECLKRTTQFQLFGPDDNDCQGTNSPDTDLPDNHSPDTYLKDTQVIEVVASAPKRIVPFSYDIGAIDHHGHGNYTLPPVTTIWYETQYDPDDSGNYFREYSTQDGGGPNTWPPHPSDVVRDPPPSSPPKLISDHESLDNCQPESAGLVVNIVLSEYIASGKTSDAYRGVAEVQYQGHPESVKVPIVAKYLDGDVELPEDPRFDLYDPDERVPNYYLEIAVLQVLRHSGAVPLFYGKFGDAKSCEDGYDGGKYWLIMEDCGERADLNNPEVQSLVWKALKVAHAHGIVHTSVKPKHILWNSESHRAKLIDWESVKLDVWSDRKDDFDRLANGDLSRAENLFLTKRPKHFPMTSRYFQARASR